jgi:hypothetical protein
MSADPIIIATCAYSFQGLVDHTVTVTAIAQIVASSIFPRKEKNINLMVMVLAGRVMTRGD